MNTYQLLPHLYYFLAVYKHKSFAKVAEEFHVSPSAVSYQVKMLEEKVGMMLLRRDSGQRSELTADGEQLANQCYGVIRHLDEVLDNFINGAQSKEFRITAPLSFGNVLLSPAMMIINAHHQKCDFTVILSNDLLNIIEDNIDLALRNVPPEGDVEGEALMYVCSYAIASEAYLKKAPKLENLDDLEKHTLIDSTLPRHDWSRVERGYPGLKLPLKEGRLGIKNNNSILEAVKHGHGIGLMPSYVLKNMDCEKAGIKIVLQKYINERTIETMDVIYACYPKLSVRQATVKKIIVLLRKYLKEAGEILID